MEFLEAFDGLGHAGGGVPTRGPVRRHLGRPDEDVLVHQRGTEITGVDRPAHGIDLAHDVFSPCCRW
jgi:hypothetical protein